MNNVELTSSIFYIQSVGQDISIIVIWQQMIVYKDPKIEIYHL